MEKESTCKKGKDFEDKFAEFMKMKLWYKKSRTRVQLPLKINDRGTNVDIIGKKNDIRSVALDYIITALIAFIIGVVAFALYTEDPSLFFNFDIPTIVLVGLLLFLKKKLTGSEYTYVWVECKDLKGKANINMITKLKSEIEGYDKLENKEYNFDKTIFVSKNGFVDNALKLAINSNIECYYYNDDKEKFEKLVYL